MGDVVLRCGRIAAVDTERRSDALDDASGTLVYPVSEAVGLPECDLPAALAARLPTAVATAPWEVTGSVVSWTHEVNDTVREAYPAAIRPDRVALAAWALVIYDDSPVGPYDEIALTLIGDGDARGHIPFIAVDSPASIVGGRANWLLPKVLAAFEWAPDGGGVMVRAEQPDAPGWAMSVSWQTVGEPAEVSLPNDLQQVSRTGDVGWFDGAITGEVAPAVVMVDGQADGPLAAVLRSGRFDGGVMAPCRMRFGPLRAAG
jgi:hypothetical protein